MSSEPTDQSPRSTNRNTSLTSLVLNPAISTFARTTGKVAGKAVRRAADCYSGFNVFRDGRWRACNDGAAPGDRVCSWCTQDAAIKSRTESRPPASHKSARQAVTRCAPTPRASRQSRFRSSQHCPQNGDRLEDAIICGREIGEARHGMIALRVAQSSSGPLWRP
jgi:hypothetical protein